MAAFAGDNAAVTALGRQVEVNVERMMAAHVGPPAVVLHLEILPTPLSWCDPLVTLDIQLI